MTSDPDQIRNDIEATRSDLSANVNALADSVRPSSVARRQADRVKGGLSDLKDKVMGTADDASSSASDSLQSVKQTAGAAPSMVARKTRGNPLAAGLIAFGGGWLLASLLPASSAERQAAETLKEKAAPLTETVTETAKQAAQEVGGNLQEPARQAVEEVKSTASDAGATVKDEAQSSASDVAGKTQSAAQEVRNQTG